MTKKKYPDSQSLKNVDMKPQDYYVTWDGGGVQKQRAMKAMGKAVESYDTINKTTASHYTDYSDLASNVSGRPGLTRKDYEAFRPSESIATKRTDILKQANSIYYNVGLIRNIIDLMGDFACQGVHLVHPNKRIEKFYQDWFDKVNGKERSERFLNYLYRLGNVVIRKQTAKIKKEDKKFDFKTFAKPELKLEQLDVKESEIPLKYTFIDPSVVNIIGGALSSFVGDKKYTLSLPRSLAKTIQQTKDSDGSLSSSLPEDIKMAAKSNKPVLLNPDKTSVFHYKKDDWQEWAMPMIHAIMSDIIVLEKMKLADLAALDGAISNVRIFKLGNLEHKIAPTEAAASKLAEILENHTGVGTIDLVWGPDIEMLESKTTVHEFLGEGKYAPVLNSIYAGIGIPPTLTGTFGASGTTNNFISLKTLIKRLTYGRMILANFWREEVKAIQLAMGFRFPADVEFDHMNLGDEEAEKSLWIQMSDRSLISDELFQRKWGHNPDMERVRTTRENRERKSGRMPRKSGPYHDPQIEESLKKIALQTGITAPSEVGLDLEPKKKGEKNGVQIKQELTKTKEPKTGQPQQGRPKNSKDTTKRKEKKFAPKIKAVEVWAKEAQNSISEILNNEILVFFDKKNMRSLSASEHNYAEELKFNILCHLEPFSNITQDKILASISLGSITPDMLDDYKEALNDISNSLNRPLTLDEIKSIQASLYTEWKMEND